MFSDLNKSIEIEEQAISKLIEKTKKLQKDLSMGYENEEMEDSPRGYEFQPSRPQYEEDILDNNNIERDFPSPKIISRRNENPLNLSRSYEPEIDIAYSSQTKKSHPPPNELNRSRKKKKKKSFLRPSKNAEGGGCDSILNEKYESGVGYYEHGEYHRSLECFSECLSRYTRMSLHQPIFLCNLYLGMGNSYYCQGNFEISVEMYERVEETIVEYQQEFHRKSSRFEVLRTYGLIAPFQNIGLCLLKQKDYEGAHSYFLKAMNCAQNIVGVDRIVMSDIYHNLGVSFDEQGNIASALKMYKKSVWIREKILGKKHPLTVLTYENIAQIYKDLKKYKEAIKLQKIVIAVRREQVGIENQDFAMGLHKMALILYEYGAIAKSLYYMEKAYNLRAKILGASHPLTKESYKWRSIIMQKKKKKTTTKN